MKIECSGPNGETFEASFNIREHGNKDTEWVRLTKEVNDLNVAAAQKALETWCGAFKVEVKS
jgi:hypothetical protein